MNMHHLHIKNLINKSLPFVADGDITAVKVILAVAKFKQCHMSQETISHYAGVTREQVNRLLKGKLRYVIGSKQNHDHTNKQYKTNDYWFNVKQLLEFLNKVTRKKSLKCSYSKRDKKLTSDTLIDGLISEIQEDATRIYKKAFDDGKKFLTNLYTTASNKKRTEPKSHKAHYQRIKEANAAQEAVQEQEAGVLTCINGRWYSEQDLKQSGRASEAF